MNCDTALSSELRDTAGEAVYPGKATWKNEPGNRYTAEQLREMERNWEIQIIDPDTPELCSGD
jgi:hypothetical protein